MPRATFLWLVIPAALWALFPASALQAQLPRRLQNCLPYPTLAEEAKDMLKSSEEQPAKVRVAAVAFEGENLPEQVQAEISTRLKESNLDQNSPWLDMLREVAVTTLGQYGYFSPKVTAQARVLSSNPAEQQVSIILKLTEARQYNLEKIQFSKARAFTPEQLRSEFPLQDGELFNLARIREGFDALTRLYGSRGYINITATPEIRLDHARSRISVLIELGEGEQFRVGSIKVLALDGQLDREKLKMRIKPGDVFNSQLIQEFYNDNKSVLPADVSPREDTQVNQDIRSATVAIVFDVRACP